MENCKEVSEGRLIAALASWRWPPEARTSFGADIETARAAIPQRLAEAQDPEAKSELQIAVADWLYRLVRHNVKRGRAFALEDVLASGRADCLGYAKLFSALGDLFGLELGIVEVLVDNAGRFVPHHVNLLNLADGTRRFIDAWYGSTDIHHLRIGALVDGRPRDIDREELGGTGDLKGLPDSAIEAITFYVKGNRYLERGDLEEAIRRYSRAIELYPHNSRAFYNRALARERKGDLAETELDYAQALRDPASMIRVLATIEELEHLIKLDEMGLSEQEQDIYLCHKGFKTGEPVNAEQMAQTCNLSPEDINRIISMAL